MSDRELLEQLREWLDHVEPPPETYARMQAVATQVVIQQRARRHVHRHRRRRRVAGALALALVLIGSALAVAFQLTERREGRAIPATDLSEAALRESRVLGRAPWLFQPAESPRLQSTLRLPSLVYPPGTDYATALRRLYRSAASLGELPSGTRLGAPLPPGVVWRQGEGAARPALDLTAPFGYARPNGRINTPSLTIEPATAPQEAARLGALIASGRPLRGEAALRVDLQIPQLAPCQVQEPGRTSVPCRLLKVPGPD